MVVCEELMGNEEVEWWNKVHFKSSEYNQCLECVEILRYIREINFIISLIIFNEDNPSMLVLVLSR